MGFSTRADSALLKGDRYDVAIIDECQDLPDELLGYLYSTVISPALMDRKGTVVFLGTPGPVEDGYYYKCAVGKQMGWKQFKWTWKDNPFLPDPEGWLASELEQRGLHETDPVSQREYFANWVKDSDELLYRFSKDKNLFDPSFEFKLSDWDFVLGIDLGFKDRTALVVFAYNFNKSPHTYVIDCEQEQYADVTRVAELISKFQSIYPKIRLITDSANAQAVAELQNRFNLPIEAAEKKQKAVYINLLNDDLRRGRVKLNPIACKQLIQQLDLIQIDPRYKADPAKRIEKPGVSTKCDLADAFLYGWRHTYGYLYSEPQAPEPKKQFKFDQGKWLDDLNEQNTIETLNNAGKDEWDRLDDEYQKGLFDKNQ